MALHDVITVLSSVDVPEESPKHEMAEWRWKAEFHGWVHTATLAVVTVLVLFVVVLGSFGNILVLLSTVRRMGKKGGTFNLLLLHLCSADLLLCLVLAPMYLYTLFADPPVPQVFCGSLFLLGTSLALLSLLSIVAIAIHRQSRVAGRGRHSLSSRHTRVMIGVVWVVSGVGAAGTSLPAMLGWRESYDNCQVLIHVRGDLLMPRFTLFFLGPVVVVSFIVITYCYVVIARAVRAQSRARLQGLTTLFSSAGAYQGVAGVRRPDSAPWENRTFTHNGRGDKGDTATRDCRCCSCRAAAERESKAVTMCVVVMVSLLLCWSPLLLSQVLELFTGSSSIVLLQVKLCGIALIFLNSALDPYLYVQTQGHSSSRYGRLCWDLLHCQCTSPRRTSSTTVRTRAVLTRKSSLLEVDVPGLPRANHWVKGLRGADSVKDSLNGTWMVPRRTAFPATRTSSGGRNSVGNRGPGVHKPVAVMSQKMWRTLIQHETYVPSTASVVAHDGVKNALTLTSARSKGHHTRRTTYVMPDVTTRGHRSWCRVHVSSDQSLVES